MGSHGLQYYHHLSRIASTDLKQHTTIKSDIKTVPAVRER
jgi:hypothetical protein